MQLTLAEAAKSVGRSKSALLRSIKSGRLSAARDALTGGWMIDPSELARLYPARTEAVSDAVSDAPHTTRDAPEITELRARLEDALDQIQDLRRQRDRADEERRRAQEQLVGLQTQMAALLTDQRPPPSPVPRRWWNWRRQG
jgi:hypothetical protein